LQLGLTAFEEIKKEVPASNDSQANAMLQRVAKRVAAVSAPDLPNAQWVFILSGRMEIGVVDDVMARPIVIVPGGFVLARLGRPSARRVASIPHTPSLPSAPADPGAPPAATRSPPAGIGSPFVRSGVQISSDVGGAPLAPHPTPPRLHPGRPVHHPTCR